MKVERWQENREERGEDWHATTVSRQARIKVRPAHQPKLHTLLSAWLYRGHTPSWALKYGHEHILWDAEFSNINIIPRAKNAYQKCHYAFVKSSCFFIVYVIGDSVSETAHFVCILFFCPVNIVTFKFKVFSQPRFREDSSRSMHTQGSDLELRNTWRAMYILMLIDHFAWDGPPGTVTGQRILTRSGTLLLWVDKALSVGTTKHSWNWFPLGYPATSLSDDHACKRELSTTKWIELDWGSTSFFAELLSMPPFINHEAPGGGKVISSGRKVSVT